MSSLKRYNEATSQWEYVAIGKQGITGATGPTGPTGPMNPSNGNILINAAFEINQRGFTSVSTVGQTYGFDRWQATLSYSTGTATYSAQQFAVNEFTEAAVEPRNYARLTTSGILQSDTLHQVRLNQRIEGVRTFSGQTATVSFWARAATGTPKIQVSIGRNSGGGSPANDEINAGFVNISQSWTRYSVTVAISSVSSWTIIPNSGEAIVLGLMVSAGSGVSFGFGVGTQNNTFDIWGVQFESGTVATPFRRNAPSIQAEIAACQRYYEKSYNLATTPGTNTTNGAMYQGVSSDLYGNATYRINFQVAKRVTPSLSVWTTDGVPNVWKYQRSGVGDTNGAVTWTSWPGTHGGMAFLGVGAAYVPSTIWGHWVAEAEL